jgi:uracil-DNA glycosylase family 4
VTAAREAELAALYEALHVFAAERDRGETDLAPRHPVARSLDSDVLLLAQGLAQGTQRVTGYPYRSPTGLSPAGLRLDELLLRPLGYTIDHTDSSRTYVYSTDLIPWYPGRAASGRGDAKPTSEEVELCWRWFEREVALVEPRAIVLLGKEPAVRFLHRYGTAGGVRSRPTLGELTGRVFEAQVGGRPVVAVATVHPSAAWGALANEAAVAYEAAVTLLLSVVEHPSWSDVTSRSGTRVR